MQVRAVLAAAAAMLAGALLHSLAGIFVTLAGWTVAMCFTWPALEAHATHGESAAGTKRMVGLYNLVWSGAAGSMYFLGGTLFKHFGAPSLFQIPAALFFVQFALVHWLERLPFHAAAPVAANDPEAHEHLALHPTLPPEMFLRLAWLANPFAYIAINSLQAMIPARAAALGFDVAQSGWFWSVWFLARFVTFAVLWRWHGWHYRFRWMLGAFLTLIASYGVLLLGTSPPSATLASTRLPSACTAHTVNASPPDRRGWPASSRLCAPSGIL